MPAKEKLTASETPKPTRGLALKHRVGTDLASESVVRAISGPTLSRFSSDTGEIRWHADDRERARLLVDSPRTKLALGFIADDEIDLGEVSLKTGPASRGFGVVCLTSLDGKPLSRALRMLLTTLANAENQGQVWNEDRTSVSDRWGTSPPMVEIVPAEVSLEREAADTGRSWKVYPLDPTGARKQSVRAQVRRKGLTFRADPADETLWYEIISE
jgi:hypothetical protein